jgi:hypothetical protein
LISDIPAGDGKTANSFLQCIEEFFSLSLSWKKLYPEFNLEEIFSLSLRSSERLVYLELALEEGFLRVELARHEVNQVSVSDDESHVRFT